MKKLKTLLKKRLFPLTILCLLLAATGIFGSFSIFAQRQAEKSVKTYSSDPATTLFKNYILSEKAVKATCEKFGFDYDTVTTEEIFEDRDRMDYAFSADLKLDKGDRPLLASQQSSAGIVDDTVPSLEVYLNEVYAFDGGEQVIQDACEKYQISVKTGVIGDFTIEQLIEIERQAYETSPPPKS